MQASDFFSHARRALFWSAGAKWFEALAATLGFLVMVRLVGPDHFGVFGLALLTLILPETIVGGALSESLIQRDDLKPGHTAGAMWLQLVLSLVFAAGLVGAAPYIAASLHAPELEGLVPLIAATLPIIALSSIPVALLQRELRFRAIAAVDVAAAVTAAVVGISLGVAGFGVWALGWMEAARRVVRSIGFFAAARRGYDLRTSLQDIVDLASFNLATLGARVLSQAESAIPRLLLGLIDTRALGYFNLAQRCFQQGSSLFIAPMNGAVLPLASRIQTQREKLFAALDAATSASTFIAYPVFFGAAAIAPVLIPLVLGPDWTGATLAVQLMLMLGVRAASASFNGGVLRAAGRPGVQAAIVTAGFVVTIILSPFAAPFGAAAIAGVLVMRGAVTWGLSAVLLERTIGYPASRQFSLGWESMIAASIMAATVLATHAWLDAVMRGWILAPLLFMLGVVVHALMLSILSPSTARHFLQIAAAIVRRDGERLAVLLQPATAAKA